VVDVMLSGLVGSRLSRDFVLGSALSGKEAGGVYRLEG